MKALYNNIKALRIAKGWSQEELALRLGYKDRSMLAKIEAGKVDITVGKVEAFADAFGVAPVDLIGWRDDTADGIAAIYAQLNNEGKMALQAAAAGIQSVPAYSKKGNTIMQEAK